MKAENVKRLSINSRQGEIDKIESEISKASEKGLMCFSVNSLSPAAKQYFIDNGFAVNETMTPELTVYTISWN
jgi:hypothetical protein